MKESDIHFLKILETELVVLNVQKRLMEPDDERLAFQNETIHRIEDLLQKSLLDQSFLTVKSNRIV